MHPKPEGRLLTRHQVAAWLQCSPMHVRRLPLPRIQLGKLVRYHPDAIRAWLAEQQTVGKVPQVA